MRRVPRGVARTLKTAVGMAEHGAHAIRGHTLLGLVRRRLRGHGVRGPVGASVIDSIGERPPAGVRAGQDVVLLPAGVVTPRNHLAFLIQHGRPPNGIAVALLVAVEVGNTACDHLALGVEPRAVADTAASVDLRNAGPCLGAEIGMPGLAALTRRSGEVLADLIGACEPAEIACSRRCLAGDKETHRLLRLLGPEDARSRTEQRHSYG